MRTIIGRFVVWPDRRDALRRMLDELLGATRIESGCIGDQVFMRAGWPPLWTVPRCAMPAPLMNSRKEVR